MCAGACVREALIMMIRRDFMLVSWHDAHTDAGIVACRKDTKDPLVRAVGVC